MDNLLIPIDIIVPEKGSDYFKKCRDGFELAFNKVNKKGEINRIIYPRYHHWTTCEDGGVPEAVMEVFAKESDTTIVILALSSKQMAALDFNLNEEQKRIAQQCIAMAPLASDPNLPAQITNLRNSFFLCPPCTLEAKVLAQFSRRRGLKIEEGRIFCPPSELKEYVNFFRDAFKSELETDNDLEPIHSENEITSEIKWVLLLGGLEKWDSVRQIINKWNKVRQNEKDKFTILSTSSLEDHRISQNLMSLGKDTIFYSYFHVNDSFKKEFKSAFGYCPHIISALCYDCVKIIVECIRKSGAYDSPTLKWTSKRERFEDCATGAIIFDENGNAIRSKLINKKVHMELVFIKTMRENKKGIVNYERLEPLEEKENDD